VSGGAPRRHSLSESQNPKSCGARAL